MKEVAGAKPRTGEGVRVLVLAEKGFMSSFIHSFSSHRALSFQGVSQTHPVPVVQREQTVNKTYSRDTVSPRLGFSKRSQRRTELSSLQDQREDFQEEVAPRREGCW